jgi:hypothetical protein
MSVGLSQPKVAYDAWEHLCADAFDHSTRGSVALLTVYSDASYNQPTSANPNPILLHTVGAYMATREDWRKFRREWKKELDKRGVNDFHANKFERARSDTIAGRHLSKNNPYCGWVSDDFVPFQRRLQDVINRKRKDGTFRTGGFIASVVKADFDKTLPSELKNDPGSRSHYIFNVVMIMEKIAAWAEDNRYYDPIHYVFAGGDGEGGNLENWFDDCFRNKAARNRYRLSKGYSRIGYSIEWAQKEPALQAADMAAYEFNKVSLLAAEKGRMVTEDEVRKSLLNLCRTRHEGMLLTERELVPSFKQMLAFYKKHGKGIISR